MKYLLPCLLLPLLAGAADPAAFEYVKDIEAPAVTTPRLLAVPLDTEVYQVAQDDYADVRILDADGRDVPRAVRAQMRIEARHRHERLATEEPWLDVQPGKPLRIDIALKTGAPNADGLTIVTPHRNFSHQVRVEGSVAGQTWQTLVEGAAIYDYSQYMNVRETDVALPSNNCRRFRIWISEPNQEMLGAIRGLTRRHDANGAVEETVTATEIRVRPLRIDRVELWQQSAAEVPVLRDYPLASWEAGVEDGKTTVAIRTNGEPLVELRLAVAERNFSRPVRVEDADGRVLARATLRRIDLPGINHQSLTVPAPENSREFRVVIENADNPPLTVEAVTARGRVDRLIFVANPGAAYRLVFGWPEAPAPSYDLPTLIANVEAKTEPLVAALGPRQSNSQYDAASGKPPFWARREFLISALVLMVAALGLALVHAAKRGALPDDNA